MITFLSIIAKFFASVGKWLVLLAVAVVFLNLVSWAITQVFGFNEYLPMSWQGFIAVFVVTGICKKVLRR